MASFKERYDVLFPAIEADIKAAWPEITDGTTQIYHGRPRQEITPPVAVLLITEVPQTMSGGFGTMEQDWTVDILGIFDRPVSTTTVMSFLLEKASDLTNQFESRLVWPGGGYLGNVEQVSMDEEGEEGMVGVAVRLSVKYACAPAAP